MATSRAAIRKQLRSRRRALSASEQRHAALGLFRVAAGSAPFRNSDRIGFYLPNDGELDILPLLEHACSLGKHCYLPVLDPLGDNRLRFLPWEAGDPLTFNRFGIPEPRRPARERVRADRLDLLLMPLVAFDCVGNRLGMGGGFYDRTLAFLRRRRFWHRPICYGVAHDLQEVDGLDAKAWDVPLDGCLTNSRLLRFNHRRRAD